MYVCICNVMPKRENNIIVQYLKVNKQRVVFKHNQNDISSSDLFYVFI